MWPPGNEQEHCREGRLEVTEDTLCPTHLRHRTTSAEATKRHGSKSEPRTPGNCRAAPHKPQPHLHTGTLHTHEDWARVTLRTHGAPQTPQSVCWGRLQNSGPSGQGEAGGPTGLCVRNTGTPTGHTAQSRGQAPPPQSPMNCGLGGAWKSCFWTAPLERWGDSSGGLGPTLGSRASP